MATDDHLKSSSFIKSIHQKLREDSRKYGKEEAWQKHCKNEELLKEYASAMEHLASYHWENNYIKNTKAISRVEWCHEFCQTYFINEEVLKQRKREIEIGNKINIDTTHIAMDLTNRKFRLLDVGSCYNPFIKYECYDVVAVDIAPARSDVYKCDFLNVKLGSRLCSVHNEISELQIESFEIVVFSLLLEYLPSPSQRHLCCEKAYKLLKTEGILIIITPDSKHVGANAKIMKSWRFILAHFGFSRIKYEKLAYLHCMVFRKCLRIEIARRWAELQNKTQFYQEIYIPQDFQIVAAKSSVLTNCSCKCDVDLFDELPRLTE